MHSRVVLAEMLDEMAVKKRTDDPDWLVDVDVNLSAGRSGCARRDQAGRKEG